MALDQWTLRALGELAKKWGLSKAEVMRRAVRQLKEEEDKAMKHPKPLEALDWLQKGGGLSKEEALVLREEIAAERKANRYWWE